MKNGRFVIEITHVIDNADILIVRHRTSKTGVGLVLLGLRENSAKRTTNRRKKT